ncbi:hypothetical protein KAFR_0A06540 [Kazachstania africana CBS 2517]|uniref:Uncharacterized protein n=1 Tax=Kazachstania africana (strain ATCC 22294 / BCRC 22015 / CBS 2517 / CECT 1963 / NBRC 1671 / NRRL Y-8276) TaxID=1071382 RepID=H2ANY9_KAZAF|nr:hypothetical protein KAFR_0A06540 [Kazachstania africana CBS 2517]CCF56089.1 hypothetical protein KAFR_0A06540 [Kazachstania africana CBS 2517]
MSTVLPFPDELVDKLCEEIAYNKGKIKLSQLWNISKNFMVINEDNNKSIKNFIFSCLSSNSDVLIHENEKILAKNGIDFEKILENEGSISVSISEDKLWIILTGYSKKESSIGNMPFELLLEIAKSKENGINTMELTSITKQDSRSITGRIKKISHLISDRQIVYKGHLVKHITLKKFANLKSPPVDKPYVNMREQFSKIVEIVKNSKNGIRQTTDLKRELNFDKEKRLSKAFIAAISFLDEKGYLKKVYVVSPNNPRIKIRCVKYLRDYVPENSNNNSYDGYESSSSEDGEDNNGANKLNLEEEEMLEGLDSFNATGLLQSQNGFIMEEQPAIEKETVTLNRFYPLQNQTFDLVEKKGQTGLSTMDTIKTLVGTDYKRAFTKISEFYIGSSGKKQTGQSSDYNLTKIYDFEGKKKFFRLFTEQYFNEMTNPTSPFHYDGFSGLKSQTADIISLNKGNYMPLNTTLRFGIDSNNNEVFFWNGEDIGTLKTNAIKKLTKQERKRLEEQQEEERKAKKRKLEVAAPAMNEASTASSSEQGTTGTPLVTLTAPKVSLQDKSAVNIDGFTAASLRSLQRQKTILEVLKSAGGILFLREQFLDEVSRLMKSSTLLDKKTVNGDIELMIKSQKLNIRYEPKGRRRLLYLPNLTEDDIIRYLTKEKDKKKTKFSDVTHNTDIYFFDQTAKDKFNRGTKSAERVRKYQNKTRKKATVSDEGSTAGKKKIPKVGSKKKEKEALFSSIHDANVEETLAANKEKVSKARMVFHVAKKSGIEALIMSVVITKSITNEIQWSKISQLFPKNALDNLKKQWTKRRVKMGHAGWKAYVDKWKKILVLGIKNEKVTLEQAENLDLPVLINLWVDYEKGRNDKPVLLYQNYEENRKRNTFVKDTSSRALQTGLVMSSMIQRETSSLKQTYTYELEKKIDEDISDKFTEGQIRSAIRSILIDKVETGKDEISLLNEVPKEELDKIIMDMAKEKQVYLRGSKLAATSIVKEYLELRGSYQSFLNSATYTTKFEEFLTAGNGIVIHQEISDIAACLLIDLIVNRKIRLDIIPMPRDIEPFNYTTRHFEIDTLTPPLIVSGNIGDKSLFASSKNVPVPLGKAYSRLWIDSDGLLRQNIWKQLIAIVIKEVMFHPGVTVSRLEQLSHNMISEIELDEICQWLVKKDMLYELPFKGYCVNHQWYRILV